MTSSAPPARPAYAPAGPPARWVRRPSPGRSPALRRRLAFYGDLMGTLGIAIVVASIALWLHGGGIAELSALGGVATSLGRLTGMVAAALLLLQVLLMARIPFVEMVWGQDVLARRHRWVGFSSFMLMLVHIVLITIGYAQSGHVNLIRQAWDLVVNYPGMLLATAGTLALIMVVVTSLKAARRRLRYESWHLLHLYAYLGVGLALPHQLWTGADFISSTASTVFWWTLWAAAAGSVLVFRLGIPLGRSWYHELRVFSVVYEGPGVLSVVISGRRLDRMGLRAGQFCQWRFRNGPGWTRANPYSISAVPTRDRLRITVKIAGDGSRGLRRLRPGCRVLVEGPHGTMTAPRRERRDALMVCAGVGVTPMRALAEEIAGEAPSKDWNGVRRPSVVVLQRIARPEDAIFAAEFAALARQAPVRVIPLTGKRAPGSSFFPGPGPVDAPRALTALVPHLTDREVYLCGPRDFMDQARHALHAAGVPGRHIHAEEFGW